jgi:hypothetical protein
MDCVEKVDVKGDAASLTHKVLAAAGLQEPSKHHKRVLANQAVVHSP